MKILAVDDDGFILELLEGAMEAVGYPNIQTAGDAEIALGVISAATQPFECFLLDIQMPVIDGIELCSRIRAMPQYQKTPIIMLTAMSERGYIDRAFAAGATDYVTKPFDVLELGTRVKMAERLNAEIRQNAQSYRTLDSLTEKLIEDRRIDLDDLVDVRDVDGFLNYQAFENYVALLGRGSYYSSSLISLKIENIKIIHKYCTATEFEYAITDFAEAISDNLTMHSGFFTYAGNGIYVCVYNRVKDAISEEFALQVQDSIAQMNLVYNGGQKLEAIVRAGPIVNPGLFSKPGSTSVIEQAIKGLENVPHPEGATALPSLATDFGKRSKRWPRLAGIKRGI